MATRGETETTTLLDLGRRLVRELARLLDQRLELLKTELKQEATDILRGLGLAIAGVAGASVGVALLLLALGVWVGDLVGLLPGGLAIVGGGLVLIGAALSVVGARSLQRQRLMPQTVRELRRDAEWIRDEG